MKILIAPDSYKGSLTAVRAADIIADAARAVFADPRVIKLPVADGGEGTVDAFVSAVGGEYRAVTVTGPLGDPLGGPPGGMVNAKYAALKNGSAVMEMAEASGIALVPAHELDPLKATSKGTGELLRRILEEGATDVWIGIGGSATNDGGMGALKALGAVFTNSRGKVCGDGGGALGTVARVNIDALIPQLKRASLNVICDVTNTLLGENGATYVYGPQKGTDSQTLKTLEAGMENYAAVFKKSCGIDLTQMAGGGAAGGIGAAFGCVLGAKLHPGIDAVLEAVGFKEHLSDADLVVTGEGCIDGQSVRFGKAAAGIVKMCGNAPVAVIAGGMEKDARPVYGMGNVSVMTTICRPMSVETAMAEADDLLYDAAERAFRFIKMGMGMRR